MKLTNLYLGIAVLSILFAAACAKKTEAYHCIAAQGEQCATQEWFSELQDLKALNKKYSPPEDTQKHMREMSALLQNSVPPGFSAADWDDAKQKFVRKAPMPTMSQPVPVVPAK